MISKGCIKREFLVLFHLGLDIRSLHVGGTCWPLAAGKTPMSCSNGLNCKIKGFVCMAGQLGWVTERLKQFALQNRNQVWLREVNIWIADLRDIDWSRSTTQGRDVKLGVPCPYCRSRPSRHSQASTLSINSRLSIRVFLRCNKSWCQAKVPAIPYPPQVHGANIILIKW